MIHCSLELTILLLIEALGCRDAESPVVWRCYAQPIWPAYHDCPHHQQAADTSERVIIFTLKPRETPPHPHPCCLGGGRPIPGPSL